MKNVVIGMTGVLVIVLLCAATFSVYGRTSRSNELEHGLSYVVRNTLEKYYGKTPDIEIVKNELEEQLQLWISSESTIYVEIKACDFEEGILSVNVREIYNNLFGIKRENIYEKTAIIE